jgi:hypothetical protein
MSLLSRISGTLGGGILSPQGISGGFKYGPGIAPNINADSSGILNQVMSGAKSARKRAQGDEETEAERRAREEKEKKLNAARTVVAPTAPAPTGVLPPAETSPESSGVKTYPLEPQPDVHVSGTFVPENEREQVILAAVDEAVNKYVASGDIPPEDAAKVKALQLAIVETESGMGRNNRGPRIGIDIEGDPAHYGQRALGPFQFMPSTARSYGLKDPMDIRASAEASVKHMLTAYKQKGDWRKAAIAHHSGPYYKKLGKYGRDYAKKLDQRVGKYYS